MADNDGVGRFEWLDITEQEDLEPEVELASTDSDRSWGEVFL